MNKQIVVKLTTQVLSRDGDTKVGKISKQWTGFLREAYTDADAFGINFPMDLDVRMKAVMLGACFLIVIIIFIILLFPRNRVDFILFIYTVQTQDFMYFEDRDNRRR